MLYENDFDFSEINFNSLHPIEKKAIQYCLKLGSIFSEKVCNLAEEEVLEKLRELYNKWGYNTMDDYIKKVKDEYINRVSENLFSKAETAENNSDGFFDTDANLLTKITPEEVDFYETRKKGMLL